MTEKRAYKRSPIELAASYGIPDAPQHVKEATVTDISRGGLSFASSEKMPVGKKIELSIDTDAEKPLVVHVKVVWARPETEGGWKIGMEIIETDKKILDKFWEFYSRVE